MPGSLFRLSEQSIQQLASDQVVTSLQSVVKELLENSLDAGSTNIEIRIQGLQQIMVKDNGSGISLDDCPQMAQRHFTSKLRDMSDLERINTYGFRGEALHSICNLSASVSITTRTVNDPPVGNIYQLDRAGCVKQQRPIACQVGTTVCIEQLFDRMPVRRQEAERTWSTSIKIIVDMLVGYGMIHSQVRLSLRYERERKSASSTWQKAPAARIIDVLRGIYGAPFAGNFQSRDLHGVIHHIDDAVASSIVNITAILPRPDADLDVVFRAAKDRCFIFVNKRPVEMPSVYRLISDAVSRCLIPPTLSDLHRSSKRCPCFTLDINMDPQLFDVNVEPAKNVIFMHQQGEFDTLLERLLEEVYAPAQPELCTAVTSTAHETESAVEAADEIIAKGDESNAALAKQDVIANPDHTEWSRGRICGLESGAQLLVIPKPPEPAPTLLSSFLSQQSAADSASASNTQRSAFEILMNSSSRQRQEPADNTKPSKKLLQTNPEFKLSLPVDRSLRRTLVDIDSARPLQSPIQDGKDDEQSNMGNKHEIHSENRMMINISDCYAAGSRPVAKQMKLEQYYLPTNKPVNHNNRRQQGSNKCTLTTAAISTHFDNWLRSQRASPPSFQSLWGQRPTNEMLDASNVIGTLTFNNGGNDDCEENNLLVIFKVPADGAGTGYNLFAAIANENARTPQTAHFL